MKLVQSNTQNITKSLHYLFCTVEKGRAWEKEGSFWYYPSNHLSPFELEFLW
jgi:hypothetical protein